MTLTPVELKTAGVGKRQFVVVAIEDEIESPVSPSILKVRPSLVTNVNWPSNTGDAGL